MQTYLRRDIRQSGKSDFRWSTSACVPVFIQSGINYPPGRLLWQSADNQMVQTVRLEACGASYQTKRTQNIFMLSYPLTYSILLSTTSQRLAVRPFSPERETCCMLPVNQLSCAYFLTKWKKCNIVSLFLQIHIVESTIHHSLMRTVHPFFQERSCILHFPFWRNFSILSFYKKYSASLCKTTCFTPSRISKGCASSKQSLRPFHSPYILPLFLSVFSRGSGP